MSFTKCPMSTLIRITLCLPGCAETLLAAFQVRLEPIPAIPVPVISTDLCTFNVPSMFLGKYESFIFI